MNWATAAVIAALIGLVATIATFTVQNGNKGNVVQLSASTAHETSPDGLHTQGSGDEASAAPWEKSNAWARTARARKSLYEFLEWYYGPRGYPLFERLDPRTNRCIKYPVTIIRTLSDQENDAGAILDALDPTIVEEQHGEKSPFVIADDCTWFQRIALRPDDCHYDGIKYISRSINKNPLRISGALGRYSDVLRTCDGLEREILDFFGQHDPSPQDFEQVAQQLTLRRQLHRLVQDPVVSGEGRCVALAMSVLIVYEYNESYYGLIEKRSHKTVVHSNLYHVVPSFMVAPEYGAWRAEWDVWRQFQREFLEEVLGAEATESAPSGIPLRFDWFYNHPELEKLSVLIKEGRAHFRITGAAVNLLNLRPEICGLLLIDAPEWMTSTRISYNWEFSSSEGNDPKCTGKILGVPISSDRAILDAVNVTPENVVPSGSAALWLGVDMARRMVIQSNRSRAALEANT